ncbi:MAG: hypothetical protein PUK86_12340 [bacterium]|nr:hypothetical protein [bacterium]
MEMTAIRVFLLVFSTFRVKSVRHLAAQPGESAKVRYLTFESIPDSRPQFNKRCVIFPVYTEFLSPFSWQAVKNPWPG